jgi:hypothetical protein
MLGALVPAVRLRWIALRLALAIGLALAGSADAVSPWTPEAGQLSTTASVVYQRFDSLYQNKTKVEFDVDFDGKPDEVGQLTSTFGIEYGIVDDLSLDLALGYTRTFSSSIERVFGVDLADAEGLDDVEFGLTWRVVDELDWEEEYVPSLAIRAGAVIKGSYDDIFFPVSAGDKGSGFELEVAAGKILASGYGVSGVAGYRDRDGGVPPDWHVRAEAFYHMSELVPGILDRATVRFAFDQVRSTKGRSFKGLGTGPVEAGSLKEVQLVVEMGLALQDAGGREYGFVYGRTLDAQNSGEKDTFGFSITLPWELPHL